MISQQFTKIDLFSDSSIIKTKYNFNWESVKQINEEMIEHTLKYDSLEKHGLKSSYYNKNTQPHTLEEYDDFFKFIEPIIKNTIINEWKLPVKDNDIYVAGSFVVRQIPNSYMDEHDHPTSLAIVTAYLQFPKNSGFMEIKDPYHNHKEKLLAVNEDFLWKDVVVEENDVIIVPGWIRHRTQKNKSEENRWALVLDICHHQKKNNLI